MRSMENKKRKFSLEDFEKGLMLAGLVTPQNSQEIEEYETLMKYEEELSRIKSRIYFQRAVLAAEIVNNLKDESTFGRVKFQKLVYLCEHACNMNLQDRYTKFAAGPFDNKFMHSINKEFQKQKWFIIKYEKKNGYSVPRYYTSTNIEKYKFYYTRYFKERDDSIQKLINLF